MITELPKSLKAVIYERSTSPFYGTLLVSWLIWNWKIIYLTLFVSESNIEGHRIQYILNNYVNNWDMYGWPLIITGGAILIIPFLTLGAFWVSRHFRRLREKIRLRIDKKTPIDEEKYVLLLEKNAEIKSRYHKDLESMQLEISNLEKLLATKNQEISSLRFESSLGLSSEDPDSGNSDPPVQKEVAIEEVLDGVLSKDQFELAERILDSPSRKEDYIEIIESIQKGWPIKGASSKIRLIAELEVYDLVEKRGNNTYSITKVGKPFTKYLLKQLTAQQNDMKEDEEDLPPPF